MPPDRALLAQVTVCKSVTPAKLGLLHDKLGLFLSDMEPCLTSSVPVRWKLEFTTAVMEICSNVFEHAIAGLPVPGNMKLRLKLYQDRVEAKVTDDGTSYTEKIGPAHPICDRVADLPERGRGLTVARAVSDELRYWKSKGSTNN